MPGLVFTISHHGLVEICSFLSLDDRGRMLALHSYIQAALDDASLLQIVTFTQCFQARTSGAIMKFCNRAVGQSLNAVRVFDGTHIADVFEDSVEAIYDGLRVFAMTNPSSLQVLWKFY